MRPKGASRVRSAALPAVAVAIVAAGAGLVFAWHRIAKAHAANLDTTVTVSAPKRLPSFGRKLGADERYPFTGKAFAAFVADSYEANRAGDPAQFRKWLEAAYAHCPVKYPGKERLSLVKVLRAERRVLARRVDRRARAAIEYRIAAWMHKVVKSVIPRFSLDRGYEFVNVVRFGERQCFLQSVLIAALLQEARINAGVAMVYRNIEGQPLNNGHAVCLVKLSDGLDVIIDASEPMPTVKHQGLFLRAKGYVFVSPRYDKESSFIAWYAPELLGGKGTGCPTTEVRTLDRSFLMSQFWHYRGERVLGGLINGPKTPGGLQAAQRAFERSLALDPSNPLPTYFLGRVYLEEGLRIQALAALERARGLYQKFGWTPDGPKEFLAIARR